MPHHTPGTDAGRRLRRKRNFRRRAGTDPDRAQALMWETDRADTDSERIRQRSGRNSSFDRAFPGVFPYARSVPFREHPPGQTRRALYEDMAYYRLFVRPWKRTR